MDEAPFAISIFHQKKGTDPFIGKWVLPPLFVVMRSGWEKHQNMVSEHTIYLYLNKMCSDTLLSTPPVLCLRPKTGRGFVLQVVSRRQADSVAIRQQAVPPFCVKFLPIPGRTQSKCLIAKGLPAVGKGIALAVLLSRELPASASAQGSTSFYHLNLLPEEIQ